MLRAKNAERALPEMVEPLINYYLLHLVRDNYINCKYIKDFYRSKIIVLS